MRSQALLIGATGIIGSEVRAQLAAQFEVYSVSRTGSEAEGVHSLHEFEYRRGRRTWDVVVNCSGNTRWTMTGEQARSANVEPLEWVMAAAGGCHLIHVSTAFVGGIQDEISGGITFRNEYERSKALAEEVVAGYDGPLTIVRPGLVLGRFTDGHIRRFVGIYTIVRSLASGLAAVMVGDQAIRVELIHVDQVARVIADAAGAPPTSTICEVNPGGGERALTVGNVVEVALECLNRYRVTHGVERIPDPPFLSAESWSRFFRPFSEGVLSTTHLRAIDLLSEFSNYTSHGARVAVTHPVDVTRESFARSVAYWLDGNGRAAARPLPLLPGPGGATRA